MRQSLKDVEKIVIKIGTQAIMDEKCQFDIKIAEKIIQQISELKALGKKIILVSSGAIGFGNYHLGWKRTNDLLLNQCSAAVGQNLLMNSYARCFEKYGITISQLLLKHDDINDEIKRKNLRKLVNKLIDLDIITIINENDSVSTEEISFGDNDLLSARVSNLIKADLQILLSHVNGLYRNVKFEDIIDLVESIDSNTKCHVNEDRSSNGKGGMTSKLISAQIASDSNTKTVIANSRQDDILKKIISGENVGTLFYLNGGNKK